MRIAAAVLALCVTGCALVGESPMALLRHAESVQTATTGPVAAESAYVRAYRQILSRPGSSVHFAEIYRDATPAGRVYALAGLYETDRRTFDRLVATEFVIPAAGVPFVDGCIVSQLAAGDVRERLTSGHFSRIWRRSKNASSRSAT